MKILFFIITSIGLSPTSFAINIHKQIPGHMDLFNNGIKFDLDQGMMIVNKDLNDVRFNNRITKYEHIRSWFPKRKPKSFHRVLMNRGTGSNKFLEANVIRMENGKLAATVQFDPGGKVLFRTECREVKKKMECFTVTTTLCTHITDPSFPADQITQDMNMGSIKSLAKSSPPFNQYLALTGHGAHYQQAKKNMKKLKKSLGGKMRLYNTEKSTIKVKRTLDPNAIATDNLNHFGKMITLCESFNSYNKRVDDEILAAERLKAPIEDIDN